MQRDSHVIAQLIVRRLPSAGKGWPKPEYHHMAWYFVAHVAVGKGSGGDGGGGKDGGDGGGDEEQQRRTHVFT